MFNIIFNSKRSISNNVNFIIESHTGLLVREYLHQRIWEEKGRTERTNIPFSLIFIDLSFAQAHDIREKIGKETLLGITIDAINANSRETDLKGWVDDDKMGILMPGTSHSGAATLCNKLIDFTKGKLSRYLGNNFQLEDWFSIISYPEIFDEGNDSQDGLRDELKKPNFDGYIQKHSKTLEPRQHHEKQLDNGETLTLPLFPDVYNGPYTIRVQKVVKRLIDIIGSLLGIIIFLPALLIIAIAVKLTSPGPVLFRQKRVGLNGKPFIFLKFRSMYYNCDQNAHREHVRKLAKGEADLSKNKKNGIFSYKLQNDNRVTTVGRFLRTTSLDELPQLFNVLKGDMSLVGPRPYPLYEVENCRLWQHPRLMTKPGITGLAQLYGRYDTTYTDAYRLDLQYTKKWSLWLDLKILIRTVPFVFSGRGAL